MKELDKAYSPQKTEDRIYKSWEESGAFKPSDSTKEPFSIIMPPPNANGSLHIGHAVFVTLEDLMIRYHRMKGEPTLWLPGADHAGFETQVVFEKKLDKEGRNRFEIPRDELYQEMLDFTLTNKKTMELQMKKLGASCDWSREKFTLDPDVVKIVYETFKTLYEDGLVYRAARPVNWCIKHQTSLSDLEVKFQEETGKLYYIKYPLVGSEEFITIATTRPETMFGDTAVAVNPTDARYKHLTGKKVKLPLTNREIPIIADEMVDPKFGTGLVKITPAHDVNDFEAGKRHNLEMITAINEIGKLTDQTPYEGLKILEAREKIVEDLQKQSLIGKIDENYIHSVGHCYKCNSVIEPRILPQWFIATNQKGEKSGKNLSADALEAVDNDKTKFVTEKFAKIFKHWMTNIRDWNISRQIVWGIRIPAWFCEDCDEVTVTAGEAPQECAKCHSKNIKQDKDVFDTWFSSGQWPFVSLKTNQAGDFEKFYPTSVMETGWDILFFWVARMIMLGLYATDEVPFKNVYLHGLVRDKDRQKMSKSKGNVIDPLGIIDTYGTDALRMALVYDNSAGNDIIISEEKINGMKKFANKLWNIARFIMMNPEIFNSQFPISNQLKNSQTEKLKENCELETGNYKAKTDADKKILDALEKVVASTDKNLDEYKFGQAAHDLYDFIWHDFADVYIEQAKKATANTRPEALSAEGSSSFGSGHPEPQSGEGTPEEKENTIRILLHVLTTSLKLLHPIMPFVTEEIWQKLRENELVEEKMLITAKWPNTKSIE